MSKIWKRGTTEKSLRNDQIPINTDESIQEKLKSGQARKQPQKNKKKNEREGKDECNEVGGSGVWSFSIRVFDPATGFQTFSRKSTEPSARSPSPPAAATV